MKIITYTFFHRDDICPNCGARAFWEGVCDRCNYGSDEKVHWE